MTENANKVRLVVGLFGAARELSGALAELGDLRLRPGQLRVLAAAGALGDAPEAFPAADGMRAVGTWVVCEPVDEPFPWRLSARAPADPAAVAEVRALLGLQHWSLRRQVEQLDRHLRAGGALLLVEPGTDAEEQAVCTALLRHASGGVQTHEIARQARGGPA